MAKRVVLAHSGGLDTSVAVRWLQEELGLEVIAVALDVGQGGDFEVVRNRALAAGAVEAVVIDARAEMAEDFVVPAIAANARYEGKYPLVSSLSRPVIVRHLVDEARRHGADAVAHGCTGKGNDQVRFDVAVGALAPELRVVAPVRDWDMGRPQELEYAAEHGIEVPVTTASPYSVDANLWGRSIETGVLEDPWVEPPDDVYEWTAHDHAPGVVVEIGFERGIPVSIDGRRLEGDGLVGELNTTAGARGIGRIDHVENRLVGIKSREVYEAPAAVTLHAAHHALESLTITRDVARFQRIVADEWARLVYDGLWFSALRTALDAFVQETQVHVTGAVRMRLEDGVAQVVGRRADRSLYSNDLATYDRVSDTFDHAAARGFIELFGLPLRTQTRVQGALEDSAPLDVERRTQRRGDA